MSLINDALKRASQSQPPAETPLAPPLQPTPSSRQPRSSVAGILLAVFVCAVVLAGWFFWKGSSSSTRQPGRPAQVAQKASLAPAPKKEAPKPIVPVATALPTQEVARVTAPAPTVSTTPSEPPKSAIAPEPTPEPPVLTNAQSAVSVSTPPSQPKPPTFPDLQVKAIAYHPTHGKAIINNRAVGAGEEIDGVRITKIEPSKVTVEWNGQTKELFLE